jgi:hypothetical protein
MPERTFNPTRPVIARRFFVAAGRHYNPGDLFEWQRLAVDRRRVRLMFDAGKLEHPESEPSIETEMRDEDIHHVAVTAAPADAIPADEPSSVESPDDGLDGLTMPELREIAAREDAPTRVSRASQVLAIRETRQRKADEQAKP